MQMRMDIGDSQDIILTFLLKFQASFCLVHLSPFNTINGDFFHLHIDNVIFYLIGVVDHLAPSIDNLLKIWQYLEKCIFAVRRSCLTALLILLDSQYCNKQSQ